MHTNKEHIRNLRMTNIERSSKFIRFSSSFYSGCLGCRLHLSIVIFTFRLAKLEKIKTPNCSIFSSKAKQLHFMIFFETNWEDKKYPFFQLFWRYYFESKPKPNRIDEKRCETNKWTMENSLVLYRHRIQSFSIQFFSFSIFIFMFVKFFFFSISLFSLSMFYIACMFCKWEFIFVFTNKANNTSNNFMIWCVAWFACSIFIGCVWMRWR